MAYNLMIEFRRPADWREVHAATRPFNRFVEYFPIPSDPPALGVSVPQKNAAAPGWQELLDLLTALSSQTQIEVVDLFTGEVLERDRWGEIKGRLLGEA